MKERILELLKRENITAAEFADRIGVQRSNVSHILNGRNNPGFSFIQKIMETFPSINSRWLLTGEGMIYEGINNLNENKLKHEDLFSAQSENNKVIVDDAKYDLTVSIDQSEKIGTSKKTDRIIEKELFSKRVIRVLFFYDDHTFEDFLPAEKM